MALSLFIGSLTWCQYIFNVWDMVNPLYPEVTYSFEFALGMAYNWCFLFLPASTGARLVLIWLKNQEKEQELVLEKAATDLNVLKSEIDLPFVLQSLSYIEEVSAEDPKLAQEPTILLSDVLRDSLYENRIILLKRELETLNKYIELINLQQSRFVLRLDIKNVQVDLELPSNLLLIHLRYWCNANFEYLGGEVCLAISSDTDVKL